MPRGRKGPGLKGISVTGESHEELIRHTESYLVDGPPIDPSLTLPQKLAEADRRRENYDHAVAAARKDRTSQEEINRIHDEVTGIKREI